MNQFTLNVVKGVTISPPVIGRITMGHSKVTQKDGGTRALPVRDDHFGITTLIQNKVDRTWEPHPVEASLKKANEKLVAIPVTLAYNDVNLNLKNRYSAFDSKSGRVLCSGTARRRGVAPTPGFRISTALVQKHAHTDKLNAARA